MLQLWRKQGILPGNVRTAKVGVNEAKEVGKVKVREITKEALREVTREKDKGENQGVRAIRERVLIVERVIKRTNVGRCMG